MRKGAISSEPFLYTLKGKGGNIGTGQTIDRLPYSNYIYILQQDQIAD